MKNFLHEQLIVAFQRWPFWLMFGWRDLIRPYNQTVFGPFVLTFQTFVWVTFIYWIFKDSLGSQGDYYLVYLAHGYPTFIYLQNCIIGGQSVFKRNAGLISNVNAPFFLFTLRFVFTAFCTLLFSHLVLLATLYIADVPIGKNTLIALVWYIALIPLGLTIALMASFFGVFLPNFMVLVSAITRFLFFATPILWYIEVREGFRFWVAMLNPVAHFISLSREPLLGHEVPMISVYVYFGVLFGSAFIGLAMLRKLRHRVVMRL